MKTNACENVILFCPDDVLLSINEYEWPALGVKLHRRCVLVLCSLYCFDSLFRRPLPLPVMVTPTFGDEEKRKRKEKFESCRL